MSVFALLDPAVHLAHDAVAALAAFLPTALAVVVFTLCVRLALHPLARAAARGHKAQARLAPRIAELRRKHAAQPEKLQSALAELYRAERVSPVAGCLPALAQAPFFSVMYRLFTTPDDLLHHTVFGVPLGLHVGAAHGQGQLLVFGLLYAALAGVGFLSFRSARRSVTDPTAPGAALMPYLSFGTVLFAALVPLAAGIYLLTTTAWSVAERAWLHRGSRPRQPLAVQPAR
ncbi:YidC/Oxa1 family membrane protein insertase [Kitasatospora cystarginea]|uniref:Membrane protein insertase YidC n=1 Tax=Kitasatospora cystarginea TaxID=58350 RepID=A0ABP5QP71_9ACTN